MSTLHVILAVSSPLLRDVLYDQWCCDFDVHIVQNVDNELEIASELLSLMDVGDFPADDPVVVVMSIESDEEIPSACSRLLIEFPELTILGICASTNRIRTFQLRIEVQETSCSLSGLLESIHRCERHSSFM